MMATITGLPVFYRYVDGGRMEEGGVAIHCQRFLAYRKTECGYWVIPMDFASYYVTDQGRVHTKEWRRSVGARWVGTHKNDHHWCHQTQSAAWESYKARKVWHLKHLLHKLAEVRLLVEATEQIHPAPQREFITYRKQQTVRG
jgi:hypothetical protein